MRTLRLVWSEEPFGVGWHAVAHLDVYMHFLWIGDDLWWHSFQNFACWFHQIIGAFFTFRLWATTSMFLNRFVHVAPPSTIRLLQHQFALMWCPSTYPLRSKKACLLSKLFFFCKKTFMFHFSFELSFSKDACLMISWLLITMPYISFFAIKIEKHQTQVRRNLMLFGLGHGLSRSFGVEWQVVN